MFFFDAGVNKRGRFLKVCIYVFVLFFNFLLMFAF